MALEYVMWWKTYRPPTVFVLSLVGMLFTSLTSTDDPQRSSVSPVGTRPRDVHLSGPIAGIDTSGERTIKSGSPSAHPSSLARLATAGRSAWLPRGAPLSAHFPIVAISSSLSDGSYLNFWMPMFFSTNHGGMTPACGPIAVRCLIARAQGRTSS